MSIQKADWKKFTVLCLEHEQTHLYGELIQHLPQQKRVWIRPFAIKTSIDNIILHDIANSFIQPPEQESLIFDLRNTVDLIWPTMLFQRGFDQDVIAIITSLPYLSPLQAIQTDDRQVARTILNRFLRCVWAAHPAYFANAST